MIRAAGAPVRAALGVGSTVLRFVALDPLLCRVRGHHWHLWASGHHVLKVCDRCGTFGHAR